jgi:hypothetical protein
MDLFRALQTLTQKEMAVKDYIEEFYMLSIGSRQSNEGEEAIAMYILVPNMLSKMISSW